MGWFVRFLVGVTGLIVVGIVGLCLEIEGPQDQCRWQFFHGVYEDQHRRRDHRA